MLLISDIHGLFTEYKEIIQASGAEKSLQLGDFGLGFPHGPKSIDLSDINGTHLFIRGNHDNPFHCRRSPYYAGDYGVLGGDFINGLFDKLFFVSGAWSIDKDWRTPGKNWWPDEELSVQELTEMIKMYENIKPYVVCTHDCPFEVVKHIHSSYPIPTRTGQAMDQMLQAHVPSYWIFGHHHVSWKGNVKGCRFIGLDVLETLDISKRPIDFY